MADGTTIDFSQVASPTARTAIKLFVATRQCDCVEVFDSTRHERLRMACDPRDVPHVGLWLNYGAWSGAESEPYVNIVVEPTSADHDSLADGVATNEVRTLGASRRTWELRVSVT